MNSFGIEKGTTIRQPSTANLMIDSEDRTAAIYNSPFNFQITKPQSLMNGFFSRIGTTEVVLEWCEENINSQWNNRTITVDISGIAPNTYSGTQTINLTSGFYTAKQALDLLCSDLTDLSGTTGADFGMTNSLTGMVLFCNGAHFQFANTALAVALDIENTPSIPIDSDTTVIPVVCPDIRPVRYIDFVSPQLTYCQDLKDNSTAPYPRDVLCRWYFSDDVPEEVDAYGFPIYMGYRPFNRRRLFNPPKQIKWDNNQVVGNLEFQLYDENSNQIAGETNSRSQWLMTLQFSEN